MNNSKRIPPMQTLISKDDVHRVVRRVANDLASDLIRDGITSFSLIAIYDGAQFFAVDLVRQLRVAHSRQANDLGCDVGFGTTMGIQMSGPASRLGVIQAKCYVGTEPDALHVGNVAALQDLITGEHVLVVDDIFDTGRTLQGVVDEVAKFDPKSIRTAVLLNKRRRRAAGVTIRPDFFGAQIHDYFVVGYGMDYRGWFRDLPSIHLMEPMHVDAIDGLLASR